MAVARSVRLVQYNVARFTAEDPSGASSFEPIMSSLVALQPTVLCLNEVDIPKLESRGESLAQVAEALGGYHLHFFGHVQGRYGNALLSKYPIGSPREIHLRGGTTVRTEGGGEYRIHRGLLVVEIQMPELEEPGLTVACTHLDHISERERETQLGHVIDELGQAGGALGGNVVLMGDLNALTRSDYDKAHWNVLERCNQAKGWAPPQHGCLRQLEATGLRDSWTMRQKQEQQLGWTARRADVGDRRIDYIWLGQGLLKRLSVDCRVADDIHGSDHFPLVVDLIPGVQGRL